MIPVLMTVFWNHMFSAQSLKKLIVSIYILIELKYQQWIDMHESE